jgi:hypothetical protein
MSIENDVGFPVDQLPKRYRTDENGRRVLVGLSIEEKYDDAWRELLAKRFANTKRK